MRGPNCRARGARLARGPELGATYGSLSCRLIPRKTLPAAAFRARAAKKLAQRQPFRHSPAKKLARRGKNPLLWPVFGALGEKFRVFCPSTGRRANFFAQLDPHPGSTKPTGPMPGHDEPSPKPLTHLLAPIRVAVKPLTPLRSVNRSSLKPRAPLQAETRLNSATFRPQWCQWFHSTMTTGQQRRPRFHAARTYPTDAPMRTPASKAACNSPTTPLHKSSQTLESQGSAATA